MASWVASSQLMPSDAIDTDDPVLDGTFLIWGNLLANH